MNGYKAFFKGKSIEVYAETSAQAQKSAAVIFKARKSWQVTVVLCELGTDGTKPGEQVTHVPTN
jgi:hypothetical protein